MIIAKVSGVLLAMLAVGAAVWYVTQTADEAPSQPGVANAIHSFSKDHPNWRLLTERRVDTTPLYFDHELHLVHDAKPQMQTRLKSWIESMKHSNTPDSEIPVTRVAVSDKNVLPGDRPLALSCAACHEPDASGEYMKPISFERHCVQCHQLGSSNGELVPHGREVAGFIDRMATKSALAAPAAAAPAKSGPGAKRGPGGSGGGSSGVATTQPVTFANAAAVNDEFAKRFTKSRDTLMSVVKNACTKCHGNVKDVTKIVDPKIPERWLTRSRFDHKSHTFKSCSTCHEVPGDPSREWNEEEAMRLAMPSYAGEDNPDSPASKMAWTHRTRDVMIPGIKTCVECHTPTLAGDSCVMCHTYHGHEGK